MIDLCARTDGPWIGIALRELVGATGVRYIHLQVDDRPVLLSKARLPIPIGSCKIKATRRPLNHTCSFSQAVFDEMISISAYDVTPSTKYLEVNADGSHGQELRIYVPDILLTESYTEDNAGIMVATDCDFNQLNLKIQFFAQYIATPAGLPK